jgi:photosystem II stability/assembly factor-like uncharacterized protein
MLKIKIYTFVIIVSLLYAANVFSQWQIQNSGTTQYLYSVHFPNNDTGYVCGANGIILKSIDGGLSWFTQVSGTNSLLRSVRFINSQTGFAAGDSGIFLETVDGGANWVPLAVTDSTLYSVFFVNSQTGWICGNTVIFKTTDAGLDWVEKPTSLNRFHYSVFFINPDTGWIAGSGVLKTTDGGDGWTLLADHSRARSVFFANSMTGWLCGNVYYLSKSTDGGESWQTLSDDPDSPPATFTCINFINENTGWYTSSHSFGGTVFMTSDGGVNWHRDYPTTWNRRLTSIYVRDVNNAWAVGQNGTILKRQVLTGGINSNNKIPDKYSLEQNYPNPFNPVTEIKFSIPTGSNVKISVYDILGREVAVLQEGNLKAGSYTINWNGSNYSSGVYFCKMEASGVNVYIAVKKMVLMK